MINKIGITLIALFAFGTYSTNYSQTERYSIQYIQYYDYLRKEITKRDYKFHPYRAEAALERQVYGFIPYWVHSWGYTPPRWDLVSTIAYFGVDADSSGSLTTLHGWPVWDLINDAHANGVEVDLVCCFFDWDGSQVHYLLNTPTARRNLITNLINQVEAGNADGINIDFELPALGDATPLMNFMCELSESLQARIPGAKLSIDVPAVDWRGTFLLDDLAPCCDIFFIMGYDYHWSAAPTTGPVAPLDDPGETYDISYTLDHYTSLGSGVREKLILGLPLYGFDWLCSGTSRGASTTGSGDAIFYYEAIADTFTYGHYFDWNAPAPWYLYGSYHQVWYDDTMSLGPKYQFILDENLLGVGFWALGYDDGNTEIWDQIESYFATASTDTAETLIIEDEEPGFSITGSWNHSTEYGGWDGDYYYTSTTFQGDSAFFRPNIPVTDYWEIYTWYVEGSNRAVNAKYIVSSPDTQDIFTIDQTVNGSIWNLLGTYLLTEGADNFVVITDVGAEESKVVIADAVMFVRTSGLEVENKNSIIPDKLEITCYPNPFNAIVHIRIAEVRALHVTLPHYKATSPQIEIYNINGRLVSTIEDVSMTGRDAYPYRGEGNWTHQPVNASTHLLSFTWQPLPSIPSGVYLIRAKVNQEAISKKVIYLK
ncbi:hypothetical protein JXI42_13240 [bacterium]|nr:hypothetical protein [bacterium]